MEDLGGRIVRDYRLEERIGSGGFGAVYRATQINVGREVAIKIILPHYSGLPEFSKRFESEAQIIARLEHIHIVPLFDYWKEDDGTAYIVMRWLKNGDLRARLRQSPLSYYETYRMVTQIAHALTVAHDHGIIHRDIKPGNILFDEYQNAYLSDFGIAKDTIHGGDITATGKSPTTPAYAAPEQITGGEVTARSDIYALAMTTYESLIGHYPFPKSYLQHLHAILPPLKEGELTELDAVLGRATDKDPAARYATAMEFAHALQEALGFMIEEYETTRPVLVPVSPPPRSTEDLEQTITPIPTPGDQSAILIKSVLDIPIRAETLIGRDHIVAEALALLDKNEKVLIQGFGGIGKTSLAAEIIAQRIGQGSILWLHAGSEKALTLLLALARPFDAQGQIAKITDGTEAIAIRKLLHEKAIKLVVIDDAWNGQVLKRITDAIPPETGLLVTSRNRFPIGKIITLEELPVVEALNLLNFYARTEYSQAEAGQLCQRLGNHPYALEIAGKLMQVDDLTPDELFTRLDGTPHRIEMPEHYADKNRATIEQLILTSLDTLTEEEHKVFLAYGRLFSPQVTSNFLALCLKQDVRDCEKSLTTLHRRGLAQKVSSQSTPLYRIHDLAYSFAIAHTKLDLASVIEAAVTYSNIHKEALDLLDAERTNLLKSAEAAINGDNPQAIIDILMALTVEGPYLSARGHDQLLIETLDKAILVARKDSSPEKLHYLLSKRGNVFYDLGNLPEAIKCYEEALIIAETATLLDRHVLLLSVVSKAYADQGNYGTAEARLETAHQLASQADDKLMLASVLEHQGYYYGESRQNFAKAVVVFSQQVTLTRNADNPQGLFFALQNLGAAHLELGNLDEAMLHLNEALAIARQQDNHHWAANALFPIAAIYHMQGKQHEATQAFNESLTLYREVGRTAKVKEVSSYMSHAGYSVENR